MIKLNCITSAAALTLSCSALAVPQHVEERATELAKMRFGSEVEVLRVMEGPKIAGLEQSTQVQYSLRSEPPKVFLMLPDGVHILERPPINVPSYAAALTAASTHMNQRMEVGSASGKPASTAGTSVAPNRKAAPYLRFQMGQRHLRDKSQSTEQFMQSVENAYALEEGPESAPAVHIFYDPKCAYCVKEFAALSGKGHPFKIRWIPVISKSPRPFNWLVHLASDKGSINMMTEMHTKTFDPALYALSQEDVGTAASRMATNQQVYSQLAKTGTPQLVYKDKNGQTILIPGYMKGVANTLTESMF